MLDLCGKPVWLARLPFSFFSLKTLFKFAALLLLALWLPATQHCDLEAAGLLHQGDHATHADASCSHECKNDVCATAEGAAYSKIAASLTVPPPTVRVLFVLAEITPLIRETPGSDVARKGGPPEIQVLTRTWQFARRTALPVRAPNSTV